MKKTHNKSFNTIEELRGAVIRRLLNNSQAVVFISNKAAEQMSENTAFFEDGIWTDWPRIVAIKSNDEVLYFEKSNNGGEIFFYDLE